MNGEISSQEELLRRLCNQQPLKDDLNRQRHFCGALERYHVDRGFVDQVAQGHVSLYKLVNDLRV